MKNRPAFYVVLGLLGAAAVFMLLPFVTPMLLAALLGYLLLPLYEGLGRWIKSDDLRAGAVVLAVLFLLALPVMLVVVEVADQVPSALRQFNLAGAAERVNTWVDSLAGRHVPIVENLSNWLGRVREAALRATPRLLGAVGATAIGLFILLYTLFYVLTDGRKAWGDVVALIPLDPEMKPHLVDNIQSTMKGVLYGQVVTATVQGTLAGIGYVIFSVPHALFWTFVTLACAMIPFIGTVVVWLPVGVSRLVADDRVGGIGVLLWGAILVMNIDNVIKPRLIAGRTELHPLLAMVGVFGGVELFGIVGFVLGPVLLGLLSAMLRFYRKMPYYKETAGLTPVLLAVALAAAPARAHDFWLVPKDKQVLAQTGENFPHSEVAVTPDRVASFSLLRSNGSRLPLKGAVQDKSFAAPLAEAEGIVETVIRPKILTMEIRDFERYLREERLTDILQQRKTRKLTGKKTPERYSKYAKLLLGAMPDRALGHTVELMLLERPRANAEVAVALYYRGKPLPGRVIAAGTEGNKGHAYFSSAVTGRNGVARVKLGAPGLWFLRSLHMVPATNGGEAVWESFFVTSTFSVGQ
jgi:predicted PurR-regulated permease PerM